MSKQKTDTYLVSFFIGDKAGEHGRVFISEDAGTAITESKVGEWESNISKISYDLEIGIKSFQKLDPEKEK